MPRKKPPDPNEKPQRERFADLAKKVGADMSEEDFRRALAAKAPRMKTAKSARKAPGKKRG